jgi:hypothetical protein
MSTPARGLKGSDMRREERDILLLTVVFDERLVVEEGDELRGVVAEEEEVL